MYHIRPWLLVGSYREASDPALLHHWQVDAILQMAARVSGAGREVLYLPVTDGEPLAPDLLGQGVAFVAGIQRRGGRCLVSCGAGISRSVILATAALCAVEGLDVLAAAAEVKRHHPEALFHPVLWESLTAYLGVDVPVAQMLREVGP